MRWTLLGTAFVCFVTGCWTPPETRGPSEAVAIYHRERAEKESPTRELGGPLSLDAAIALAKRSSVRLTELNGRVRAANAAVDAAGQRNNPELRVTNARVGRIIDGEPVSVTPRLRFSPERIGEIPAREAEARARVREARAAARAEEIAIEVEVRWLFDEIVLLDAEIAAADGMASSRHKQAKQTEAQVASATATTLDMSLANLSAVQADALLADRRSRRALVVAELCDRVGVSGTTPVRLEGGGDTWPPPPLPSEQTLVEQALGRSPRIAGAAAQIDGADAVAHLEKSRRWPWFRFVEVGYELGAGTATTNVPPFTVGASVELPILNTNGGAVRRAEAANDAARRHLESEVQRTVHEVRARYREAVAAEALVTEFRKLAVPALDQAQKDAARGLETGSVSSLRAIEVDERRSKVELELLRLIRNYRSSVDALRRAVSGPLQPR